jgi:hypothetical protein
MKNYYRILKKIVSAIIIAITVAIIGGVFSIYYTVWKTCDLAKEKFGGKCQPACLFGCFGGI